jgi:hypothetical protein
MNRVFFMNVGLLILIDYRFYSINLDLIYFSYAINLLIILLLLKESYSQVQFITARIIDFKIHL